MIATLSATVVRTLISALCGVLILTTALLACATDRPDRPNFLIIVADDLGFSDLGAFGGEIDTPNLDALALEGIRFTGFHSASWCTPTRAMLLSGTDANLALTGSGWPHLRSDALSLAELLADAGYRTMLAGKWHLGVMPEQNPHQRGFQKSFALLEGEHNHFGGMSQTLSTTYTENGAPFPTLPKDFYSSDYFATRLIGFLREPKPRKRARQPFFAYLAFSAPHGPLMARGEEMAKYRGRYDAGFDALKEARLKRQKELGLLSPSVIPHPPLFWTGYPIGSPTMGRWESWNVEQRQIAARDMEIYAAMVDRLDQNVGRVIQALQETAELDNTVILFLADNGPQGAVRFTEASLEAALRGNEPALMKELIGLSSADNRLDSRGSSRSWVRYAPGWAEAASSPSWLYKGNATEGGTRVAAFLRMPRSRARGEISTAYLSVADVLPTFLDLAHLPKPSGLYRGHATMPIMGRSWMEWLEGRSASVYGSKDAIGTMYRAGSSRSLRQGDWKITDVDGDGRWLLFNIATDPGETQDLSEQHSDHKAKLRAAFSILLAESLSGSSGAGI